VYNKHLGPKLYIYIWFLLLFFESMFVCIYKHI